MEIYFKTNPVMNIAIAIIHDLVKIPPTKIGAHEKNNPAYFIAGDSWSYLFIAIFFYMKESRQR